jgi:hypothetical protein
VHWGKFPKHLGANGSNHRSASKLFELLSEIIVGREESCRSLGDRPAIALNQMPDSKPIPRYRADITAGSLKITESRRIADMLLNKVDAAGWSDAIVKRNILQAKSPATARRLALLIRSRLETLGPDIWKLIRDGKGPVVTHAILAAAVKQSPLLGDFLELVIGCSEKPSRTICSPITLTAAASAIR